MSHDLTTFSALDFPITSVGSVRLACGIYLPNYKFMDINAAAYQGSRTGEDGLVWSTSRFRGWNYYNFTPSTAYGTSGRRRPTGLWGASALYTKGTGTTAGEAISTLHRVLNSTIYSDMIPFSAIYTSHYEKALTVALALRTGSAETLGTGLRVFVACYSSAYAHLGNVEVTAWSQAGTSAATWERIYGSTAAAMNSGTAYVQLHIGIDGLDHTLELGHASLMLNAFNGDAATASPDLFVDFGSTHMIALPSVQAGDDGVRDLRLGDGRLHRLNMNPGGHRLTVATNWYRETADDHKAFYAAWLASVRGLGEPVPVPVPLCVDFGLGGLLPWFSYWHAQGSTFNGTYTPYWTADGQGYDNGIAWEEV